jgi:thymidylate synthase ThyX
MNFLSLRTAETAQLEIREYANSVEEIFADKMPITHQAWIKNERKAP